MSFNTTENTTFVNVKLTDAGRRMVSLGSLNFTKAVLSDREINYDVDRTGYYNIINNKVLAPFEYHPDIDPINMDDTSAVLLTSKNVVSAKQFFTADTPSAGFFSGSPNHWTIDASKYKAKGTVNYAANSSNFGNNLIAISGATPVVGDIVFIPWVPPQYGSSYMTGTNIIPSGTPANPQFYRISSGSSSPYGVDRQIPNYAAGASTAAFIYPYNGINTYYSSATTQNTSVFNMNIVRTNDIPGIYDNVSATASGYTRFGSLEYNGAKHYFGFGDDIPAAGFIHFSNKNTGNTYGEQFIEKSIQLYIPMIMWYNVGENNGSALRWGASFFDINGETYYDEVAKTTYRELRDGIASTSRIVGRVYHRLRMIVITDQELLTVLSYKANRAYALPDFNVNLTSAPKYPLTSAQATGLCKKDYTYFVSYIALSDIYDNTDSFGHPNGLHCGYVKKIQGAVDINGNPQFLQLTFPPNAFPYMRSGNLSASGHGWNAQTIQVIVNEQLTADGYDIATVPSNEWKTISTAVGNGIYNASDVGDATIDPLKLNGNTFIISAQDFVTGNTYDAAIGTITGHDYLTFGNESFFHGVIDLQIFATTYKSVITVYADNNQVNVSSNDTFDSALDENTYITEIAILDDLNQVVAVGKPTGPIKKNNGRYLAFQLEIDF